ncbi:unnamed protein product [Caenorhabditis angaria]|uniref:DOMON domain-containing protein n=1 Tax=Caenorhabditis angaria TaxID=860376 RepID=A0A9P1N3H1_9PELO|nr:unnamed protein product [Caenorhabditis angaria]
MLAKLFILLISINSAFSATCSFSRSNIVASWKYTNNAIQISFTNRNIQNNQWTAIAFGQSMQNLSVIIFQVMNNQVTVRTGVTTGYGPPTLDSSLKASPQYVNLSGTTLNAVVNVPMSFNGMQLSSCQTWNFVESGPIQNGAIGHHTSSPFSVNNVCPTQCR